MILWLLPVVSFRLFMYTKTGFQNYFQICSLYMLKFTETLQNYNIIIIFLISLIHIGLVLMILWLFAVVVFRLFWFLFSLMYTQTFCKITSKYKKSYPAGSS